MSERKRPKPAQPSAEPEVRPRHRPNLRARASNRLHRPTEALLPEEALAPPAHLLLARVVLALPHVAALTFVPLTTVVPLGAQDEQGQQVCRLVSPSGALDTLLLGSELQSSRAELGRHELELQTEVASLRSGRARERRLRCSAIARASSSSRRCSCSSREDAVVPGGSGQGWGRQDRERSGRGHRVPGCTREGQPRMVCGEGTRCRMPSCAPYMYCGVVLRV
jgi:hypothetical protein